MFELIVAAAGGALILAGLAWRLLFHRTGIPEMRAVLSDPDPKVRAAALDQLGSSLEEYGPELVNLARRERDRDVIEALIRLVNRHAAVEPGPWDSPDLSELRDLALSRAGAARSLGVDRPSSWPPSRAAELVAQLERAVAQPVTWLRVLTSTGLIELKTSQEKQ